MGRIVDREQALERLAEGNLVIDPRSVHMEIMETGTPNVWLCPEPITLADWEAFDPGAGFSKTGAAESPMDFVGFRRSPGMDENGPATRRVVAGRPFIHVAMPGGAPKRAFGPDGPMELQVFKYQTVGFDAGHTLPILCTPDGSEYVQQTGDVPNASRMALPEGWTLRRMELSEPLTIEVHEGPQTFWFRGFVSFQGPIEGLPR